MYLSTVTQKGQITIPKPLRDYLGIKSYHKVALKKTKTGVQISTVPDLLDLAGSLIPKTAKSLLKARQEMETNYHRF